MIYVVPPELAQTCLEELDFREKGGYAREIITVVQHDKNEDGSSSEPKEVQALLYRGTPDNPAFWPRLLWDLPLAAGTHVDVWLFFLKHSSLLSFACAMY